MRLFERSTVQPRAAAPAAEAAGYDFVDVRTSDGSVQRMSKSQFEAQALPDRIRILVEGRAVFFRGELVVSPSMALRGSR